MILLLRYEIKTTPLLVFYRKFIVAGGFAVGTLPSSEVVNLDIGEITSGGEMGDAKALVPSCHNQSRGTGEGVCT